MLPGKNAGATDALPRITFSVPKVAQIGLAEQKVRDKYKHDLQIQTFDISKVDRAVNEEDRLGLLKITAHKSGHIVGASIVGERTGETITEIAVAMRNKLRLSDLAATVHPYPTYSTGVQLLATKMAVENAFSRTSGRIIHGLSALWR